MSNTKTEAQRLADGLESSTGAFYLAAAAAELRRLDAENLRLELLCDATYVEQGADAYNHATDEMERWQRDRFNQGKEVGTEGSLCDGIAWLYGHIENLEAERDQLRAQLAKAVAEEREACKRTCMDIHKRNDSAFALECALAIEARSNT